MKLRIIGLGIREESQITLEGIRSLRSAEKVCYLPIEEAAVESLLTELQVNDPVNLRHLYHDGRKDLDNYISIAKAILALCKKYDDVAFLVGGHPRVGVSIVQWFEALQKNLDLELDVLPGVSSFAALINDLKIDPLEHGTAMIDCNRLLNHKLKIESSINYFFYHICSVGVAETHVSDASKGNRIDLLKAWLLQFYPETKQVELICSATGKDSKSTATTTTLGDLESLLPKIHFGTTLFISAG